MCGRAYQTYTEEELWLRYLNETSKRKPLHIPPRKPNFNLSPSQTSPIVLVLDGKRKIQEFRWGLVPSWAKDIKIGYKLINARGDTIGEKPSFRSAFKRRRCIVPLSGFIEWKREGEEKHPFAIHLKDEPIMSVAGIWEVWHPEGGEELYSFSIITTEANAFMTRIHDRMPVILDPQDEAAWLDPENEDVDQVAKLLKPCPSKWLEAFEVSTAINSPKNNRAEVLEPLKK